MERGFTLLELLLALALMAVILTLIFSAFHMGSRAWEKGEKLMGSQQLLRVVPELIRRQLASLTTPEVFKQNDHWFFFRGESKSIDFFSNSSLYPNSVAGIVYIQYRVVEKDGKEKIIFYEEDINRLDVAKLSDLDDASYLDLLPGYTSITFAFLTEVQNPNENGIAEWVSSWNPDETEGLPMAIRLTLKKDTLDPPIIVIIPIVMKP